MLDRKFENLFLLKRIYDSCIDNKLYSEQNCMDGTEDTWNFVKLSIFK